MLNGIVHLRDVAQDDLPIFFAHQLDPAANSMAAFVARQWDEFIQHWRVNVLGNASALNQTIVVDEHVVGYVSSWPQGGLRLIGFWIGRQYWSRGIATSALSTFLATESKRPLHAYVATRNIGSMRVLEKCGFQRSHSVSDADGVEEYLFVNGNDKVQNGAGDGDLTSERGNCR